MAAKTIVDFANLIKDYTKKLVHWGDQSKGYVGKNLLRPTINDPTKSDSGVSWSFNADNSITINGIKTTGSTFINYVEALGSTQYATWDLYLEAGTYVLSGCESPFEYIRLTDANNNELASDVGSGKTFTLAQDFHSCKILIKLPQNTQVTNKTLYPMLRKASIPDSTYEPWYMSNRELTEDVQNAVHWADNTILGAKNFLRFPFNKVVFTGTTSIFTNNNDGTFNINGTPSEFSFINVNERNDTNGVFLKNGTYIYSGCPADGNRDSKYYAIITCTKNGSSYILGEDEGNGVTITINGDDYSNDGAYVGINIYVRPNYVANNLVWKPMIRLASDTDDTYQPYAMTNKELTDKAQGIIDAATNAADFAAFKTAIGNL